MSKTITAHTPPFDTVDDKDDKVAIAYSDLIDSTGDVELTIGDAPTITITEPIEYKFRERELLTEVQQYVDKTYDQHYATDKYQATDIIIDSGHGTGFCLGNVIKYAKRYGRKGTPDDARKDLMKVLHYALIQLYIHDEENK